MYTFTNDCIIGVDKIDSEHKHLFELINNTFEMLETKGASLEIITSLLEELKEYASTHFAHEEAYMLEINDPQLNIQRHEHILFTNKINEYDLDGLNNEEAHKLLHDLLEYLSRWLFHHIIGNDILIGKFQTTSDSYDMFAFTDRYKTGISFVDEEHAKLFEIIRRTNDVIHAQYLHDKYDKIMDILDELKEYTIKHFSDEENYMESINYEGLAAQKRAHETFINKLAETSLEEIDDNQENYLDDIIAYLLNWLSNHILKMDKLIPTNLSCTSPLA